MSGPCALGSRGAALHRAREEREEKAQGALHLHWKPLDQAGCGAGEGARNECWDTCQWDLPRVSGWAVPSLKASQLRCLRRHARCRGTRSVQQPELGGTGRVGRTEGGCSPAPVGDDSEGEEAIVQAVGEEWLCGRSRSIEYISCQRSERMAGEAPRDIAPTEPKK